MAVMRVARALPAATTHSALLEALDGAPARVEAASAGDSTKPLTRAEWGYLGLAVGFVVVGAIVGIALDDGKRVYTPPDGVSIFALFYIAAQAIERFLEPFSHFFGATQPSGSKPNTATQSLVTKSVAVKERDKALALADPHQAAAQAAWWQEMLDQIRQNTATLWAVASMIGMILSGWLGLLLLHAVKAPHAPRGLDIIITGLVIGAGTKPLHDLIGNIQATKNDKQDASSTGS
jgi:hypothetical protein